MSPTETKESTKREIAVEVPAAEVARQTDALIQKYQKLARLPGFRRGHVPASIIKHRFSEDIKTEVVDAVLSPGSAAARTNPRFATESDGPAHPRRRAAEIQSVV